MVLLNFCFELSNYVYYNLLPFKLVSIPQRVLDDFVASFEEEDDVGLEIMNANNQKYEQGTIKENEDGEEHYKWNIVWGIVF